MLSCGELCACVILETFHFSQPTLSHHMKSLCVSGFVKARREGKWTYYSLNGAVAKKLRKILETVTTPKNNCICHEITCKEDCP
ncbi:MAG: metalloregulator ArsR/SmtB family transcription factor [Holophagaceae bacterium]|nr:metalloregulator ArsR/SmtB family transcription factor [Holophagaceae bacterium]